MIKNDLKKADIIVRKKVKLTSGRTADFYCDFKKIYKNPRLLKKIADILAKKIKGSATCIAATGQGGIPLATLISTKLDLPLILVRHEKRKHGLRKRIEGYFPTANDKIAIVDDVCTYGTSFNKIFTVFKPIRAEIIGCFVVILRPEMKLSLSSSLHYMFKAEELF